MYCCCSCTSLDHRGHHILKQSLVNVYKLCTSHWLFLCALKRKKYKMENKHQKNVNHKIIHYKQSNFYHNNCTEIVSVFISLFLSHQFGSMHNNQILLDLNKINVIRNRVTIFTRFLYHFNSNQAVKCRGFHHLS